MRKIILAVETINNGLYLCARVWQIDLEEAKGQEITKLQSALNEMQEKLDEAHTAVIHEREAAKLAIEQAPPVIKEVPVVDETKLEILRNHNEELEVSIYLCI